MSPHPRLVRAVVTAAVAALPEQARKNLASELEFERFAAEDALVERIMAALTECEKVNEAAE
ncbi:hypothetical protein GCM10011494_40020 [Novosphingobium endophyticum]|uniref:Uncharacterized protein n=1 Tax=Novosphingobium endophyticum TaxID=1955250 RepID=A0A916X6F0_9SPHN|nr:hypothetical protein [Novosphingobium endophyticum]GGC17137.1 hypothetical protein GCM10011494_40020 [Novosphingobium endophyticum]